MPTASNDNQYRDSPPTAPASARSVSFPPSAIFYAATPPAAPFGFENIYRDAGPGMALVFLTFDALLLEHSPFPSLRR